MILVSDKYAGTTDKTQANHYENICILHPLITNVAHATDRCETRIWEEYCNHLQPVVPPRNKLYSTARCHVRNANWILKRANKRSRFL